MRDTPMGLPLGRVPVNRPGRGLTTLTVLVGVLVILSIAKPWDWGAERSIALVPARSFAPATPGPTATPDLTTAGLAASVCLGTGAWEVATLETWRLIVAGQVTTQQVRVWRALAPARTASGPGDVGIPIVIVAAMQLDALGWCAPSTGVGHPTGEADVTLWRLAGSAEAPGPGAAAPVPTLVPMQQIAPTGGGNRLAALYREVSRCVAGYGCSGAGVPLLAPAWKPGRYVFRYSDAGTGGSWWFGADVEVLPAPTSPPAG